MIHPLLLQNLILKESIISNDQLKFSYVLPFKNISEMSELKMNIQ